MRIRVWPGSLVSSVEEVISMNLIMGASVGLKEGDIAPFIQSLAMTGYNGEVVIFLPESESELSERLSSYVITQQFEDKLLNYMPIHALRYFLYNEYLKNKQTAYDKIMLSDLRDVYFQRDPFDFDMSGLCVFLEDITIGACPYNSSWIFALFNRETAEGMKDCQVSCSGITMGSSVSILDYLSIMRNYLLPPKQIVGYDQGVHNYILYKGLLKDTHIYTNGFGPVLTMGYMKRWEKTEEGLLADHKGNPVNIIHQYDRHPGVLWKRNG